MDHLLYLFAAFLALWGIVFVYLFRLLRRQKELLEEIRKLQTVLSEYEKVEGQFKANQPPR